MIVFVSSASSAVLMKSLPGKRLEEVSELTAARLPRGWHVRPVFAAPISDAVGWLRRRVRFGPASSSGDRAAEASWERERGLPYSCLLYTSDAADDLLCV